MRFFLLVGALVVLFSCKEKREEPFRGHQLKITESKPIILRKGDVDPPKEFPISQSQTTPLSLDAPKSVPSMNHVNSAGMPITSVLREQKELTPGAGKCALPKVASPKITQVIAGEPQIIEAKEMARKERNPLSISYFGKLEGLSHDVINCVMEDRLGNLWLGTQTNGISRFDGKNFTNYSRANGIIDNDVLCMIEDLNGNIWFGTSAGASRFDGQKFTNYLWDDVQANSINCLASDKSGNIWLGSSAGVIRYDGENFHQYSTQEGLSGNSVYSIYVDASGRIWFGTMDGGVTRYDGTSFIHFTQECGLISDRVLSIHGDKDGSLWFGTAGAGAVKFDGQQFYVYTTDEGLIDNTIGWIETDHSGSIWFGTPKGACSFSNNQFSHFDEQWGMSSQFVYGILADRSNNIWVATAGGGLCRISGMQFRHYDKADGLCNASIQSIQINADSTMWLGSEDGLILFNDRSFLNYSSMANSSFRMMIHDLFRDDKGFYWIAVDKANIIQLTDMGFRKTMVSDQLASLNISCVGADEKTNVWLGTFDDGVIKFDGEHYQQFKTENGLSHNRVKCSLEDSKGNIWFGTEGGGVTMYDGNDFFQFTEKEGVSDFVYCMLEDSEKNIWMGTRGNGLLRYDGKSFTHFTTLEGLSNDNVFSLQEEITSNGSNLWIGTRQGLSKMSLRKINELIQGGGKLSEDEVIIESFDPRDGFIGVGCNLGAMKQANDGAIWIGANNLLTKVQPHYFTTDTSPPLMVMSGLELFSEKISWSLAYAHPDTSFNLANGVIVDDFQMDSISRWYNLPQGLTLAYDNNDLTFQYVGVTMHQPWKVKYRYKLEGFDEDWSSLTSSNSAQYGNLPAGVYTFKVKAMGSGGVWSAPYEYSFTVLPPWWRNWWSYGLYVMMGLLSIVMIFRWRIRSLRVQQKRLETKIEQATQVILDQKNEVERQKDFAEAQRMEAEEQRRIAQEQKLLVEDQNKEILDSIEYAKRIQTAILPPSKTVSELLRDSFVLYLPKDIVAGDFYWMDALGEDIYFAACDCTGHGVPGAMVSVVCNYVLNASVNEFSLRSPGAIFDKSRELLVENFAKSDEDVKDGMDASMCALNFKNMKLQWSGANNPLWIYRAATKSIEEIKPDKQPIGKGYELKPFTTHQIDLYTGDIIYVFTDGYADQFGGDRNKKLTRSKFRELLLGIAQLTMNEQYHELLAFHKQYRGAQEQVDDICIIGVRV